MGLRGSGMILPAVTGNETIEYNHVLSLAPDCVPGNNNCRMQQDKYEAARIAGVSMGIHMLVNNESEPIYVNAGDFVRAHEEAIRNYDRVYRFDASEFKDNKADIVIVGAPHAVYAELDLPASKMVVDSWNFFPVRALASATA